MKAARATTAWFGVACAALAASASPAQVFVRGQAEPYAQSVLKVDDDGVHVTGHAEAPKGGTILAWDVVRRVDGPLAQAAQPFMARADKAWRARSRLERGDVDGAEPLFEELSRELTGKTGPTAAMVFEGLCRCRLARGAPGQAAAAWLDWVQAGSEWTAERAVVGGRVNGPGAFDESTRLLPTLPPMFVGEAAASLARLLEDTSRWNAPEGTAADLAMLYLAAARYEAGLEPTLTPIKTAREGVRLTRDIVQSRVGSSSERAEARARLLERAQAPDVEPWVEAWCRCAIGRSLLRDDDADRKRQGLVQLLHVPARFARITPGLAGLAVAEAAAGSARLGDAAAAQALKSELAKAFPRHVANGWAGIRDIAAPRPAPAATPPAPGGAAEKEDP